MSRSELYVVALVTDPKVPLIADTARFLRDRADSYWRDSVVVHEDGDLHAAVAYRMIAEELRRCAEEIAQSDPPPAPLVADPALLIDVIGSGTKVPRKRR